MAYSIIIYGRNRIIPYLYYYCIIIYKGGEDGVQIREFQHSGKILFSVYTSVVDPDNLICGSGSRNVKKKKKIKIRKN
jgi:hypothetical protein